MAPVVIRSLVDSYVTSGAATKNYGTVAKMYVGTAHYSYLFWGNPMPANAKVVSAVLHLYTAKAWSGSVTVTAQSTAATWSANKITWNNKPGVTGATAEQTKSNAAKGTRWDLDITAIMQAVASGQAWSGLRLIATGSAAKALHSAQASASYRPWVEITWVDQPQAPTNLTPRGGAISTAKPILHFNFLDTPGNQVLSSLQIQISTVANFASTVYDSGVQAASVPVWDLTPTAFSAVAGTTYYWRARVTNSAGLTSDWSAGQTFKYVARPTVTLTSPSDASPYVEEPSPPVAWNFSGTQTAYRVLVVDPLAPATMLYDSGTITSTNTYHTIPSGVLTRSGKTYTLTVHVMDDQGRVATPGFPPYSWAQINFDYRYSATVTPCSGIVLRMDKLGLGVAIDASRSVVPDYFTLTRNGEVLETNIVAASVQDDTDPTLFHFTDFPPGRQTSEYMVIPVVNGRSAASNPTAEVSPRRTLSWIVAPDGTLPVGLANPSHDLDDSEISAVVSSVAGPPILITQSLGWETGSMAGVLSDRTPPYSLSARTMLENLRTIRREWNGRAQLLFADESMKVYIRNLSVRRVPYADGSTDYDISFEFFQVG